MKKTVKIKKEIARMSQKFHDRIHSHGFRKMLLLLLVIATLVFDILVMGLGKEIARGVDSTVPQEITKPWEKDIKELLTKTPMEKMTPYISQKEKKTAAFLVSIAKKESNWGKYSPHLEGKDCYNYWGFRDQSLITTSSGYTCFSNPRQAVNRVSNRISELIEADYDTPEKMVVWKCGYDCSWDNNTSVQKWISDVDYYFQKFYQ